MAPSTRSRRWFAFLRAINVGGHTVKMDRLRSLFEEQGFASVETFIASGNVVFEAGGAAPATLEKRIVAALRKGLGYEVETFLRSRDELAAIARAEPFGPDPDGTVYVGFLRAPPAAAARDALMDFRSDVDDFRVLGREVYWLARGGMSGTTFSGARLERTLGMPTTMRNTNTVHRLLKKHD